MCLGVPGQVTQIRPDALGMTMGRVDFGGIGKEVCLAYVPEVKVGDYVLVHVGFALSLVDPAEAKRTFELLEAMGETSDLRAGDPSPAEPA